jgi:hypothetical protein
MSLNGEIDTEPSRMGVYDQDDEAVVFPKLRTSLADGSVEAIVRDSVGRSYRMVAEDGELFSLELRGEELTPANQEWRSLARALRIARFELNEEIRKEEDLVERVSDRVRRDSEHLLAGLVEKMGQSLDGKLQQINSQLDDILRTPVPSPSVSHLPPAPAQTEPVQEAVQARPVAVSPPPPPTPSPRPVAESLPSPPTPSPPPRQLSSNPVVEALRAPAPPQPAPPGAYTPQPSAGAQGSPGEAWSPPTTVQRSKTASQGAIPQVPPRVEPPEPSYSGQGGWAPDEASMAQRAAAVTQNPALFEQVAERIPEEAPAPMLEVGKRVRVEEGFSGTIIAEEDGVYRIALDGGRGETVALPGEIGPA